MLLIGRFIRFLIAIVFFGFGYAVAQFANGNRETIAVSISPYSFHAPVYLMALLPLAAGLALGWLYTLPARTHEFADHWRSWKAVRRMEKENKELRRSLDHVLEMPQDEPAAALKSAERPALGAPMDARPVVVHEVKAVAKPAARVVDKRSRPARPERGPATSRLRKAAGATPSAASNGHARHAQAEAAPAT